MLYKYAILFSHVKLTVFNCKEKTEEVYMKHIVSFLWLKKPKQWQNLTTVRSSPGTLCLYASLSSRQLWKCEKEREQNFKLCLKGPFMVLLADESRVGCWDCNLIQSFGTAFRYRKMKKRMEFCYERNAVKRYWRTICIHTEYPEWMQLGMSTDHPFKVYEFLKHDKWKLVACFLIDRNMFTSSKKEVEKDFDSIFMYWQILFAVPWNY